MRVKLPSVFAVDELLNGNSIQQIAMLSHEANATVANYQNSQFNLRGKLVVSTEENEEILVIEKPSQFPENFGKVVLTRPFNSSGTAVDLSAGTWLKHPKLPTSFSPESSHSNRLEEVIASWENAFSYIKEAPQRNIKGLRPPQVGAIHAVHHHWIVSDEVGTIVMPTGTGKTETMLSLLISVPCHKVLIIVPTDALRTQIANKFLTLGILKDPDCRVLKEDALFPVVGTLRHFPNDTVEVDAFFGKCHVVVTTSQIAGRCSRELQERIASHCSFLFIDEAHHSEAPTWSAFKEKFASQRVLQFTATPFREDSKPLDGKIIYTYPLKKAQEEGYFKPIQFKPVVEFNLAKADEVIAAKAVEQLRTDATYNHILMARVGTVERAKKVFSIYEQYEEFNPVQIHTGIKSVREREKIRQKIISGDSKIIVCVDMLGEGFDLPELKIAAFHDIRKSLAVTLQLAGRFTRARSDLGDATFIANIADVNVRDELKKLYRSDTDWNLLLPELSDALIDDQVGLKEFVAGFANFPDDIPLRTLRPALSTVVYKTRCADWKPEEFHKGLSGEASFERIHHDVNHQKNTLVIVTAQKSPIDWTDVHEIFNWSWDLYMIFWDRDQRLLFIHNSSNSGVFAKLASAIAGDDVELINEQTVFRCLYGINRLKLQNVGLSEHRGRLVRYTGRMGSDVEAAVTLAQRENTSKSVVFGTGYENGHKASIGASRKGRIWSFATANIESWTRWCKEVGRKILDDTIDPDEVLKGTLESEFLFERPVGMPIGIDWPEEIYRELETSFSFILDDDVELPLFHTEIALKDPSERGDLKFVILSGSNRVEVKLNFFNTSTAPDIRYTILGSQKVWVKHGGKRTPLENFFYQKSPVIWFADGSSLEGNKLTALKRRYPPYEREKIQTWDWQGIDLTKESQGHIRATDSIQFRAMEELKRRNYQIIFDDDDHGEAADIVTIRVDEEVEVHKTIEVEFYHCKFSQGANPGARIKDLYEVCGQAQKSIHWMEHHDKQIELFTHLMRRESRRNERQEGSRFDKGSIGELITLREMARVCRINLKIFIIQPGLSKTQVTPSQLELLSVTENYLMDTFKLPFGIIASP